jgi:hypothetical protein
MRNVYHEARIIIPTDVPPAVIAAAEFRMLAAFGGFTRMESYGVWLPAINAVPVAEPVFVYDIACAAFMPEAAATGIVSHESERAFMGASGILASIARDVCRDGAQQCVYLRHPTGEVQLISLQGAADAAGPVYRHSVEFWRLRAARGY